ncbi:ATP-binding cassette domain-containing protein [Agrobacterium rosae]|uniref:ATP-binding cassette domain-containing protein n=1 Tax=Agrobacterium rosae TaxID=1972867 RepID=UPI002A0AF85E|nr:ATP-binding cassette domain-containing protein [Agrobacterium rosae]MDX8314467.1 ATP-binding cassette domain-containing protein [Agrobacterium rosae]
MTYSKLGQVKGVSNKGATKQVTILGTDRSGLHLHRFAMVGKDDELWTSSGLEKRVKVVGEADFQVVPIFDQHGTVNIAGREVFYRLAEVVTHSELSSVSLLESFHYRSFEFADNKPASKKTAGGRRSLLLLQLKLDLEWMAAGYIELQMPLMMAKPRHRAFERPYAHPDLPVSWENWRKGGQSLVNRIARIARVVVHPELRGAGLSRTLVDGAITFSRERWHIGGKRPLFIEISAEMLRHIDFVSRSGFHYLGNTEGNHARLATDMLSMKRGQKTNSGIMSLQKKYYSIFENYRKITGDTFESLQARLREVLSQPDPWDHMEKEEWLSLRPLIRSPIPYFMRGLDEYSDAYVKAAAVPQKASVDVFAKTCPETVTVRDLTVVARHEVIDNKTNRMVMNAFGVTSQTLLFPVIKEISFDAQRGTTVFISGASGTGKSVLLTSLDPSFKSNSLIQLGVVGPQYRAEWLTSLPDDLGLFEFLSSISSSERAFDVLSKVGLSEATLFLKPFSLLSRGQRYRAMLARLMLSDSDVWLIDEFCSDLDPLSAGLLADRLRKTVRAEGKIAFLAAANHGHFINALKPAQVVKLDLGGSYTVMQGRDYINGI